MADSILRLKVESQEYDAKIKRAAEGIQDLAKRIHDSQGEFAGLDDSQKEFIKNMQYMTTVSKTTTGQARELETAYKQLQALYNGFNGFEKNSEEGKLLAEQLSILKQRTLDAKSAVSDASKSLEGEGSILDSLTSKFTFNIDALKLFDTAMSAVKSALDVAKDAFFASEENVDEWGRTIQAAEGVYSGFLNALNTGDYSGFLSRIDEIVKAAREAYNELDRLGTMRTIQAPSYSKQDAENARMRTMLMTGKWISAADGRVSPLGLKDGDKLSAEMMRVIERQLQGGMNKIVSLTKNEIGQTGKAIDAYYNSLAKQNGMSYSEFKQGTSSMAEFDKRMAGYQKYQEWRAAHTTIDIQTGRETVARGNPWQNYAQWGAFRVDKQGSNSFNDLVNLIKQQQSQQSQLYSTMGQAYRTMNRVNGETIRGIMGGGTGGGGGRSGGGGSVFDISKISFNPEDVLKPGDYKEVPSVWAMFGKEIGESLMEGIEDPMSNLNVDDFMKSYQAVADQIEDTNRALQQQKMAYNLAGQAAQNFGAALQGLEDPAAKAAGTVVQAIASIALGFAMASSQANTAGTGWGWLAWVAAGASAMATTIATIHSLTGYADGGIIKGNSYSGDNLLGLVDGSHMIGLNAGEVVLNASQTNNLANSLKGQGLEHMKVVGKLQGTDMLLLVDRTLKKSGKELAVWG